MRVLEKISDFVGKYMAILVLAVAALALFVPQSVSFIKTSYVNTLLGIVMFGMGLTLKASDFKVVFSRPKDIIIGAVAQFAASGKTTKKKSLAEIAMSYGYVYVAQVAMGANPAQTLKAIAEAEAYPGPSLVIGYAPCEMHSIKGGMTNCQAEMKKAVECGYWNLFRFNPAAETDKFIVDSKEPKEEGYRAFLMNEARYSRLTREFPDRAETLFKRNEEVAMDRYQHLLKLKAMYDEK